MRDVSFAISHSEFTDHSPHDFGFIRVADHDAGRPVPRIELTSDLHHPRAVDLYDGRSKRDHPPFIAGAVFETADQGWRSMALRQGALPIFVAADLSRFTAGHTVDLFSAMFGVARLHYDRRAMWAT